MDLKRCDFCLKEFKQSKDFLKGFCEMKFDENDDSYSLDGSNQLNRFTVIRKSFVGSKEENIDICDECINALISQRRSK